ncbi:hypothetical protein GGR52DRAFT_496187 [Hypoxylon sp. FL1284]|nr:hypothetical protein GGR52DRAFT_496187 [Hypoxylon sp. FL1284]
MSFDEENFLLSEDSDTSDPGSTPKKAASKSGVLVRLYYVALHLLVLVLAGALWSMAMAPRCSSTTGTSSWSPVQDAVEYEVQQEYASEDTAGAFSGPPTPEQDQAWDDLVRPSFFNVSSAELEKASAWFDNIAELTGGGYVATLGVYHELHCVRQLRFFLWKEKYYPHLTADQDQYLHHHLDHCLETLRYAVMCQGNLALRSFGWEDASASQPKAQSNSKKSCVKWSSIHEWSQSRMVPYNPSLVRLSGNDSVPQEHAT